MNTIKIAEKLYERYESQYETGAHYYGLLALYALAITAHTGNNKELLEKCKTILKGYPEAWQGRGGNFKNYQVGGNGKAWLVYKGLLDEERENIRTYAEMTLQAPTDSNGLLCMPSCPELERVWIDTITAVVPYMLYAGLALDDVRYVDFAAYQCFGHYELLLDRTCGLLHQCRGFLDNPEQLSDDHWSRGNGWAYVGLTALVEELPKDSKHRAKAEKYYKDLSVAFLKCRNAHGVWSQMLGCSYAWDESSGTALIAYGMGVGLRLGLLERNVFEKPYIETMHAIAQRFINADFSTNMSCRGCLCPGTGTEKGTAKAYLTEVYPQKDEVHSYGTMMLAFAEAYKNQITDLEI